MRFATDVKEDKEKRMKKLDGIIFDIDGTIWDSRDVVAQAWQAAVREHTLLAADFDGETIGRHFGKPMPDIFKAIYPGISDAQIDEMIPYLYEYEHRYIREMKPQPYPGVEGALQQLSREYPLYIVTNAQKGYAEAMLDATALGNFFRGWLSYGDTLAPKEVTIRTLMERYGLCCTCYVGDTAGDMDASQKAGIPFIYCAYGLGEAAGAECEIDDIAALPDAVHILEVRYF